jgi:hypothetical protein
MAPLLTATAVGTAAAACRQRLQMTPMSARCWGAVVPCVTVRAFAGSQPEVPPKAKAPSSSSTNLACGLVGLPNVGKSTLFNALTNMQVAAENYPFCTIDPSVGMVEVADPRLKRLSELSSSKRTVPAAMMFVDIAGLVEGASEGAGMGNAFLQNIREVDAILHLVRCFDSPDVVRADGDVKSLCSAADDASVIDMCATISSQASLSDCF